LKGLNRLRLGSNSLGDAGVAALVIGLASNVTLSQLELENNDIGDDGLGAIGKALDWKDSKCRLKGIFFPEFLLFHLFFNV
jgi:Ran GTPase-activating protein (RanGAP) involved in mRNA processing and transport